MNEFKEMEQNFANFNMKKDLTFLNALDDYATEAYRPEISDTHLAFDVASMNSNHTEQQKGIENVKNKKSTTAPRKRKENKEDSTASTAVAKTKKAKSSALKNTNGNKTTVATCDARQSQNYQEVYNTFKVSLEQKLQDAGNYSHGKHDMYINIAWNVFNECFKKHHGYSLLPFDITTDLFYIRNNDLYLKAIIFLNMTDATFKHYSNMELVLVRRTLFEQGICILNVPTDNDAYDIFLKQVVLPYMYYTSVARSAFIDVYVVDDNTEKPPLLACKTYTREAIIDCIKRIYTSYNSQS